MRFLHDFSLKRVTFTIDNCARQALFHTCLQSLGCQMLFTTYMELDTATEGRDAGGMSFDGQLFVSFRKRTVANSPRCLERAVAIGADLLGISLSPLLVRIPWISDCLLIGENMRRANRACLIYRVRQNTDYEAKKSLEGGRTVRQLGAIPFGNHHLH
jgi:hypothetical protein